MKTQSLVYVGIKGSVVALDRSTGEEVWRRALAGSDFVNVALLDGELFASARGELFALDPWTGEIRWHNPLKGLGRGLLTIAGTAQTAAMGEKKRREQQAVAAATAASS